MTRQRVAVIINPISGTGGRAGRWRARGRSRPRRCSWRAASSRKSSSPSAPVTRASWRRRRLRRGASLVLAWGGDGTVNEVASALAFRDATLGVIPSGSGNGLARELGIPLDPRGAFAVAFDGATSSWTPASSTDGSSSTSPASASTRASRTSSPPAAWCAAASRATSRSPRASSSRYVPDEHTIVTDGDCLARARAARSPLPTRASTATARSSRRRRASTTAGSTSS